MKFSFRLLIYPILGLFFCMISAGCSSNEAGQRSEEQPMDVANAGSHTPVGSVTGFLHWYRDHFDTLGTIQMVNNVGTQTGSQGGLYSVNFEATEHYLSQLKNSGYIAENFLNKWRQHFKKCDQSFKDHPQSEGPPSGFDYDFIMLSQDAERELRDLEGCRIAQEDATNKDAIVIIDFPSTLSYAYFLSKEDGRWLIADIQNKPGQVGSR